MSVINEIKEDLILSELIKNSYFREQILSHLKASLFEKEDNARLFKVVQDLVESKVCTLDEKTLSLKYDNAKKLKDVFLESSYPNENIKFLINESEKWVKEQLLKEAILKSVDIITEKKDTSIIKGLVNDALVFSFDRNLGLNYKKDIDKRFDFYTKVEERIPTGWDMLDFYTHGGLQKKTLTVVAGSSGLGKTLFGTNLTANLIRKKRSDVVYLSMELPEEVISRRVDTIVTKVPYYSLPFQREYATKLLKEFDGSNCWIREYKPSKASSINILNYLKELALIEKIDLGKIVLIVDYIQLMKANNPKNGQNDYSKYKDVAEELRELGTDLEIPVVTFSQVQRAGYNNSGLGASHIADSIAIVNTCDLFIGMTQTQEEQAEGYQSWRIIKNRLGRTGKDFRVQLLDDNLEFRQTLNTEEIETLKEYGDLNKGYKKCSDLIAKEKDLANLEKEETEAYLDFIGKTANLEESLSDFS